MRSAINFLLAMFLLGLLLILSSYAHAAGSAGLYYETYAAGGATPSISNRTLLTTGIVSAINFNWGSGQVLNSGRSDGVIVHFYGYIKNDSTETATFGMTADDGITLAVNGTNVINSWREDGGSLRSGTFTMTAGQAYYIDVWYYENGGGALVNMYWVKNGSWVIVPSTNLATHSTYWTPPLCCGGSSAAFNAKPSNVAKLNTFVTRTTADSKINIEQIGNFNTTTIEQTGSKNNAVNYYVNGSGNMANITQTGTSNTQANYVDLSITGNSNAASITQTSTGGSKGAYVTMTDSNNIVNIQQKDSGSHYAEVNLTGGSKSVTVVQQGAGNHMAGITLSGQPVSLTLTQSGSTQQFYSITSNCATAGGCSAITVSQGQ